MKYKVEFSGFAYVEADNTDEVYEDFDLDAAIYSDMGIDSVEEVDDFVVEI